MLNRKPYTCLLSFFNIALCFLSHFNSERFPTKDSPLGKSPKGFLWEIPLEVIFRRISSETLSLSRSLSRNFLLQMIVFRRPIK